MAWFSDYRGAAMAARKMSVAHPGQEAFVIEDCDGFHAVLETAPLDPRGDDCKAIFFNGQNVGPVGF